VHPRKQALLSSLPLILQGVQNLLLSPDGETTEPSAAADGQQSRWEIKKRRGKGGNSIES